MRYWWQGKFRELRTFVERAAILTKGNVLHFPPLPSRMKNETCEIKRSESVPLTRVSVSRN